MQATRYQHIVLNEQGVPEILGSTMKVLELVLSQKAYGWSPEELHFQYPHLSLGQIHSALAYYWDHKDALEAAMLESVRFADEMRLRYESASPFHAELRERVKQRRG